MMLCSCHLHLLLYLLLQFISLSLVSHSFHLPLLQQLLLQFGQVSLMLQNSHLPPLLQLGLVTVNCTTGLLSVVLMAAYHILFVS
jgi:hypothetical protein